MQGAVRMVYTRSFKLDVKIQGCTYVRCNRSNLPSCSQDHRKSLELAPLAGVSARHKTWSQRTPNVRPPLSTTYAVTKHTCRSGLRWLGHRTRPATRIGITQWDPRCSGRQVLHPCSLDLLPAPNLRPCVAREGRSTER
jgi:hypothetical protein